MVTTRGGGLDEDIGKVVSSGVENTEDVNNLKRISCVSTFKKEERTRCDNYREKRYNVRYGNNHRRRTRGRHEQSCARNVKNIEDVNNKERISCIAHIQERTKN